MAITLCLIIGAAWSAIFAIQGNYIAISLPAVLFVCGLILYGLKKLQQNLFAKVWCVLTTYIVIGLMALFMDAPVHGYGRIIHDWYLPAICFCLILFQNEDRKLAIFLSFLGTSLYLLFNLTDVGFDTPLLITGETRELGSISNGVFSALSFLWLVWVFLNDIVRSEDKLIAANFSIKTLMRKIFPESVAGELESGQEFKPQKHDDIVVMFVDIVGFTKWCEGAEPEKVVGVLSQLFDEFDEAIVEQQLCKIKTIGDAYLVAAGIPEAVSQPLEKTLTLATRFHQVARKYDLDLRIGIHAGSLVAGVVGSQRQVYDIWGDTVNTTSRIEASGVSGRVVISEQALKLAETQLDVEAFQVVSLKGKMEPVKLWMLSNSELKSERNIRTSN